MHDMNTKIRCAINAARHYCTGRAQERPALTHLPCVGTVRILLSGCSVALWFRLPRCSLFPAPVGGLLLTVIHDKYVRLSHVRQTCEG